MNTPAWLQAAGLVLWGFTAGQGAVGVTLALARLLAPVSGVRLNLPDRDLNRAVDLSGFAVLLSIAGFLVVQGLPKGLLVAVGWLPAVLFPLLLIDALGETPLRLRHLAVTLRRSTHPDADRMAPPGAPYLAMTLLAASVLAQPSPWFFWALAVVVLVWLFVLRPVPRARGLPAFAFAALLAAGGGYFASAGLQHTQLALQDWAVDFMANIDPDPYQSQTRIGDLGRIKLSERIVWRVEQAPPAKVPLLLRSGVFTRYVQGSWTAQPGTFSPLPSMATAAQPRLTLHGQSLKGAAILPLPADAGQIGVGAGTLQRNALGLVRVDAAAALLDVTVTGTSVAPALAPTAADLSLPPGFGDLLPRLPELALLAQGSERERLAGVESWFAAHFRYTLFLGDEHGGGRDIARFLLTDRAGHCEYFATSTVLLLRALGIPARYVTGYSVQEYSRLEKAFVVRQRHAHAWTEAYIDGHWVEIDTTPSTWLSVEEQAAPLWQPLSDFMSFAWRRGAELWRERVTQIQVALDLAASSRPAGAGAIGVLLVVALGWLALKRVRRARKAGGEKVGASGTAKEAPSAEILSFHLLEDEFAALGLGRRPSEPPRAWLARLARDGTSVLDESRLTATSVLIETLYRKRYGNGHPVP